jgi:hypothetical protein
MIGPMPSTVITLRQLSSLFASVSISSVTVSIRSSSCRQSPTRSLMMRTMRGEKTSVRENVRQQMAKETLSLPDDDAALQEKAANLIDHCGAFADKARPYPVQCLQIELLIGFGLKRVVGRCRPRPRHEHLENHSCVPAETASHFTSWPSAASSRAT